MTFQSGGKRVAFWSLGWAVLAATFIMGPRVSPPAAGAAPAGEREQAATTRGDQTDLAVTVYNSNVALVRDVREITVPTGVFDLRFVDIAASINPATVHFRSLTDARRLAVLEQNYEYDLLEPQRLLQKYVGREVTLVRRRDESGTTREQEVRALLLAYNNGPIWKIGDEIVTGLGADHLRFPELPENLYSRPTLVWSLENTGGRAHRVEASYLAGELSWRADYVLTVARDDQTADLDGWVTVVNKSGAGYRNARLQLVAGDLNRVREDHRRRVEAVAEATMAAKAPSFNEEAFSEYHLYTLDRKTTINEQETKQISLLNGSGVAVRKRFLVQGQSMYYRNAHHPGSPLKDLVRVYYQFANDGRAGLGVPLPAGIVRVYQADSKGGAQFAGEDRIEHTPKDETLTLHVGNAFDVVCERKQTDFRKIAPGVHDVEFEITLRNHKDAPIAVEVNEPIGGTWEMLDASHRWAKTSAWSASFSVPVEKGGTSVLKYRVRVRW